MSDWWSNFANNLATDLAPLISLFGEAPTKQYLSECLYPTDIIIFATAPLGIITAVVSTIRVYGTPSLRAFIGRAQEGAGSAEAEICSSTSRDVCELYNNGGVARVFGRPKLLEVIHDGQATEDDFYQKTPETPPSAGIYSFEDYLKKPENEWREIKKPLDDEECVLSLFNNRETPQLNFAPNPNLSLNVGIKERKMRWYIAASILGVLLQSGVLVWATLARYRFKFLRDDLQDIYAVPMTFIGTILLSTGIALCACLVEMGTKERVFKRRSRDASRLYWVQPGTQFVGDQAFDSFAYTHPKNTLSTYITSWKEKEKDPQTVLVWVAITSASAGFVLQFLGLRACHPSVAMAQLGATLVMTAVRSSLRTKRLKKDEVFLADRPEFYEGHELDWLALNIGKKNPSRLYSEGRFGWTISAARYYHPGKLFNESRKLFDENWVSQSTSSFDQPTVLDKMTLINKNTELEVLSVLHENNQLLCGFRLVGCDSHKSHVNQEPNDQRSAKCWDIQFDLPQWPDARPITEHETQLAAEKFRGDVQFVPEKWRASFHMKSTEERTIHEIPKVLLYRARLARLASSWDDRLVVVRTIAQSLARAIEDTVKILFTADVVFEHGWNEAFTLFWAVQCSPDNRRPNFNFQLEPSPLSSIHEKGENERNIYLSLKRKIDMDGNSEGRWRVDESELEAVLGIWLLSLKEAGIVDESLQAPLKRIISAKSNLRNDSNLISDFELWRAGGGFNIIETRTLGDNSNGRLFGWHNISADVLKDGYHTILELPVLTKSFPLMCAQEIYSLFFASMMNIIRSIGGKTKVRASKRFGLANTNICQIHDIFINSGLGPLEDAFTCIIPALKIQGKLPPAIGSLSSAREAAESYMHDHKWEEAEKILLWALPHSFQQQIAPNDAEYEIKRATELPNHQRLLTLALCECYRKAACHDAKLFFAAHGIVKMLNDPIFEAQRHTPLVTEGGCRHTLASTVRCYGHVVIRYLRDMEDEGTARELEAELNNSQAVDCNPSGPVRTDLWAQFERPLFQIIDSGDLSSTLYFLELSPTMSDDKENGSALSSAAQQGWYIVVKNLIDRGAVFERKDKHNRTAISYAAESGDLTTFDYLLGKGAIPIFTDDKHRSPLSYAAGCGNLAIVRKLLADARVDPDVEDENKLTPLAWASCNGQREVVELLLERGGANLNSTDSNGRTLLSHASSRGHIKAVELLLAREEVDVDLKDEYGRTPLSWASFSGQEKAVELLLETKGVDLNPKDKYGNTPLSYAASNGYEKVVELLLAKKEVDRNLKDPTGRTPLSWAAGNGDEKVVELLLATKGLDVNLKDNDGLTPLSWAINNGHERVSDLLCIAEGESLDSFREVVVMT